MKVKVYTQDACRSCGELKAFLTGNGIEFEEININHDNEAKEYVLNELQSMSTPVLEIEHDGGKPNDVVYGFSPYAKNQIAELLNI